MIRKTHQHAAIRLALAQAGRPLDPPEILLAARQHAATISLTTVYRTVKQLSATGELASVSTPNGGRRYAPAGKPPHSHFYCRKCNRVYCLAGCPAGLMKLTPPGFRLECLKVTLFGTCLTCQKP